MLRQIIVSLFKAESQKTIKSLKCLMFVILNKEKAIMPSLPSQNKYILRARE